MNTNRQTPRFILPGLLVLVALLAVTGRPDAVLERVGLSPTRDAQRNDMLALGRFAELLGTAVTFHAQMPADALPPATDGVLWLPVPGTMLGTARSADLLAWVRAGGELVIAPKNPLRWKDDPLLVAAGVQFRTLTPDEHDAAFGAQPPWQTLAGDGLPYTVDGTHALRVRLTLADVIEFTRTDVTRLLCDPGGCHAARATVGKGSILVLADRDIFANRSIARYDHAPLAQQLLGLGPQRTLWIVRDARVPTLFELLWRHAQPALLAALAAIALWLLARGGRFGPALPSPEPARRRLAEHVEAAGLLLARHGARARLWQAARDDFIRTLHRRHPQARSLDDNAVVMLVARHAGVDEAGVRDALVEPAERQAAAFAAAIRRLEILRRKL